MTRGATPRRPARAAPARRAPLPSSATTSSPSLRRLERTWSLSSFLSRISISSDDPRCSREVRHETRGGRADGSFSLIRRNPRRPEPLVLRNGTNGAKAALPKQIFPFSSSLHELSRTEEPPARREARAERREERHDLLVDHVRDDDVEPSLVTERLERTGERGDARNPVRARLLARREGGVAGRRRKPRRGARLRARRRTRASRCRSPRRGRTRRAGPPRGGDARRAAWTRASRSRRRGPPGRKSRRTPGGGAVARIAVVRVEEIALHEDGSPKGGRLGNPVGGFFFEGGKAASAERGECSRAPRQRRREFTQRKSRPSGRRRGRELQPP